MAYLAFQDLGGATAIRAAVTPFVPLPVVATDQLSALEWSVVALARRDGRASLRPASRWSGWLSAILHRRNPRLADDRLEALRRMAVLAWQDGYAVPGHELRAFLGAGFTNGQYETMVNHVSTARMIPPRTVGLA